MRLREENMFVLGMGESKTPLALTRACNRFIHLNLVAEQNIEVAIPSISTANCIFSLDMESMISSIMNDHTFLLHSVHASPMPASTRRPRSGSPTSCWRRKSSPSFPLLWKR